MAQATQTNTPTAPTPPGPEDIERLAYKRASAVKDRIVDKLRTLPRSAAVVGDLTGFRVRLNFGTNDPSGVREFAEIANVEAVPDNSGSGVWLEARADVDGIPVCAEVLLSAEAAAVFEPLPEQATPKDVQPVPPGASVLAHVPAVTPVTPTTESAQ